MYQRVLGLCRNRYINPSRRVFDTEISMGSFREAPFNGCSRSRFHGNAPTIEERTTSMHRNLLHTPGIGSLQRSSNLLISSSGWVFEATSPSDYLRVAGEHFLRLERYLHIVSMILRITIGDLILESEHHPCNPSVVADANPQVYRCYHFIWQYLSWVTPAALTCIALFG